MDSGLDPAATPRLRLTSLHHSLLPRSSPPNTLLPPPTLLLPQPTSRRAFRCTRTARCAALLTALALRCAAHTAATARLHTTIRRATHAHCTAHHAFAHWLLSFAATRTALHIPGCFTATLRFWHTCHSKHTLFLYRVLLFFATPLSAARLLTFPPPLHTRTSPHGHAPLPRRHATSPPLRTSPLLVYLPAAAPRLR